MPQEEFNFGLVKDELRSVLSALLEFLNRQWPTGDQFVEGAKETLIPYVQISFNTFETIIFVCSDVDDGSNRQELFSVAVSPLTRSLLESLFSIVYLLDDLNEKVVEFDKALFKEQTKFLKWAKSQYANIPNWERYFEEKSKRLETFAQFLIDRGELKEGEMENLDTIRDFPRVSKVKKRLKSKESPVVPFLEYLDDLHYRELSFHSHLEPSGIIELQPIFAGTDKRVADDMVSDIRSKQVYLAVAFVLSIASEIEFCFNFGLRQRLSYLWVLLNSANDLSEEIYSLRYQALLNS